MAIGTAAAIGIGLAGIGSAASAISGNKAASKAANVSAENNAANVALQREVYGQNKEALSPFIARGNVAGNAMNALLGLGGTAQQQPPAQQVPTPQPNALTQFQGYNPDTTGSTFGMANTGAPTGFRASGMVERPEPAFGNGQYDSRPFGQYGQPPTAYQGVPQTPGYGTGTPMGQAPQSQTPQTAQQAASNAFDIFRNSTGYQFRLGQGMDAVNSGYAGAGTLQSGAALKAINEYGQNFASNEFGNYMGYLGNQQGVGLSGASALAGVGQNFANSVTAGNTLNAANQANALTSRQNPFANALGLIGGGLFKAGT